MTSLEQELRELAVEWPETPPLADVVEARLGRDAPARLRLGRRRPLAVALAVLVVAAGAVLAFSPGARSALLELFGIKGATVTRVDELPELSEGGGLGLGGTVPLAEAREAVPYRIRLPEGENVENVRLDRRIGSGAVSVVWCCPRIVLTQFRGVAIPYAEKMAGPETRIDEVDVGGAPGLWIEGARHAVVFRDDEGQVVSGPRLAGNVLLWEDGDVTLRLEGHIEKERALAIAAGIR